jgi:hypothetical protein
MEASPWSFTFFGSNIAASAPTLPFPVAFDIAGVASRHVQRVLRASTSRARSRRIRRSSICRASSREQPGDGERDMDAGKKGITLEKVAVAENDRVRSSGLYFGSSEGQGFRGSPLPDFEDEFFARMTALEASSPLSSARASSTSAAACIPPSCGCSSACSRARPRSWS